MEGEKGGAVPGFVYLRLTGHKVIGHFHKDWP